MSNTISIARKQGSKQISTHTYVINVCNIYYHNLIKIIKSIFIRVNFYFSIGIYNWCSFFFLRERETYICVCVFKFSPKLDDVEDFVIKIIIINYRFSKKNKICVSSFKMK